MPPKKPQPETDKNQKSLEEADKLLKGSKLRGSVSKACVIETYQGFQQKQQFKGYTLRRSQTDVNRILNTDFGYRSIATSYQTRELIAAFVELEHTPTDIRIFISALEKTEKERLVNLKRQQVDDEPGFVSRIANKPKRRINGI